VTTFDLSGRVVLVTGGNSGIGLGIAQACAAAGADIVVWGTNPDKNVRAAEQLADSGRRVLTQVCDVGDESAVIESFATAVGEMGKVDTLFANAGVGGFTPFVDLSLDEWHRVLRVNLDGAFLCLREAARHMVTRGEGGSLVAISSVSAYDGAPGMQHYAGAKAALLAVVRGLAVELARHQIRCNSLLPGWTKTDMNAPLWQGDTRIADATTRRTPVRRWADGSDMGPAAVFLADPSYTFHTGDSVVVDGGYTIF
jgi:NAD(P)-dependent dehydrogenase (short-subunit alcohol dehydrogenase family)